MNMREIYMNCEQTAPILNLHVGYSWCLPPSLPVLVTAMKLRMTLML